MKIGKVDLIEAFSKFFENPGKVSGSFVLFALQMLIFVPIVGMFASIFMGASIDDDASGLFMILFCCMYVLLFTIIILGQLYVPGASIDTYKNLMQIGKYEIKPLENILGKLGDGFKYVLATFVYSIPIVIFFVIGMALMIVVGGMSESQSSSDEYVALLMILGMCIYVLAILLMIAYQFIWRYVFTPIIYKHIADGSYGECFNPALIWSEIKSSGSDMLGLGLSWFIVGMIWGIVYAIVYVLMYLLVGFILMPFVILVFMILRIYIEPYYMYMTFRKPREA